MPKRLLIRVKRPDIDAFRDRLPMPGNLVPPVALENMRKVTRLPTPKKWKDLTVTERAKELEENGVIELPHKFWRDVVKWVDELERIARNADYVFARPPSVRESEIIDRHVEFLRTPVSVKQPKWPCAPGKIAKQIDGPNDFHNGATRAAIKRLREDPWFVEQVNARWVSKMAKRISAKVDRDD